MTSEDFRKEAEREENSAVPAFSVSGQFMMTSEEKAVPSEDFNPRKIVALTLDDSLARLFECLTLEYSGSILLTPKWKNFRSQKLKFSEKTRINNAIWRSWHIQFRELKRPLFCQFDNPLTEMAKKPRPVTLMIEGKYWKRKLEAVAAEYQKWRVFYKHMVEDKFQDVELQHQTEEILRLDQEISDHLREREKKRKFSQINQSQTLCNDMGSPLSLVVSQALEMVDSCNLMENMVFSLPDTLFSSIAKNPNMGRVRSGTFKDTADTVQPTLDTLQPSLEAMTPVLDELIEQLEASMKGSELTWDFDSLEKPCLNPMGLIQSSSVAEVEPMDHSGQYTQPYVSMESIVTSSAVKTPWPVQASTVPTHTMYPVSSVSEMEAQLPIWTSAPIIHPNVIGYQTIGMQGNFPAQGQNAGRVMPNPSRSVIDITGSTPVITTRPFMPPTSTGKRLPATPSSCSVETPAARLPRNSSDSQLYLLAAGDTQSRPRTQLPVELQAPNLVAQLKLTNPRQMIIEEKAKRLRIPRNKSAPGLASLDSTAQLKKTPLAGGVRAKRLGRIPRNRSDSALAALVRQSEQSSSTARRGSESGDSPPSMPAVSSQPESRQQQSPEVLGKQQLYHPRGEGEALRPPSQLVHDMVSHLMSKGISMQEILNKLTSMAAAGTLPQAQSISHQINSAAGSMATILQEQQQDTSLINSPPYPTTQAYPTSQPAITSTVTTPRSRRKPQIPRPSMKAIAPTLVERSGIRPSNTLVQGLVGQNRSSTETRVPNVESTSAAIMGSNPRWGNETTSDGTVVYTLAHMSEPLNAQSAVPYPMDVEGSNVDTSERSVGNKKARGRKANTASPSPPYLPSMVMNTATSSTVHSEAEACTSLATTVTDDRCGPATPMLDSFVSPAQSKGRRGARSNKKAPPKEDYVEHRRMVHVSAEQKRRGHIKMGFDQFIEMVPALAVQAQGSTKISKASVLRKSVDYILQVQQEQENMKKERDKLKREIEQLNVEISNCQQQLPETGVMVNRQDYRGFETWFNRYIQDRTEENPKFWIFSVLMRPIFDSYVSGVSTSSQEEFCQTVIKWLNECCCLPKLRPSVLSSLRELIKNTSILSDPSKFPEQARLAASGLNSQTTSFEGLPR